MWRVPRSSLGLVSALTERSHEMCFKTLHMFGCTYFAQELCFFYYFFGILIVTQFIFLPTWYLYTVCLSCALFHSIHLFHKWLIYFSCCVCVSFRHNESFCVFYFTPLIFNVILFRLIQIVTHMILFKRFIYFLIWFFSFKWFIYFPTWFISNDSFISQMILFSPDTVCFPMPFFPQLIHLFSETVFLSNNGFISHMILLLHFLHYFQYYYFISCCSRVCTLHLVPKNCFFFFFLHLNHALLAEQQTSSEWQA